MSRAYYLTTLDAFRRNSARFGGSHYAHADPIHGAFAPPGAALILALVEADEGVHNALGVDPEWEALPHPMTNRPVSARVAGALAAHGVASGATTFDVAEALARAHPILRYRVF
jgi:hypothetical protein